MRRKEEVPHYIGFSNASCNSGNGNHYSGSEVGTGIPEQTIWFRRGRNGLVELRDGSVDCLQKFKLFLKIKNFIP